MNGLLIGFGIYLVIITGFALAALYHCFTYASRGDKAHFAAGLYLLIAALILIAGFVFIGTTDFSGELP